MKYYKLFNEQENHHGFQYQDGLNTDTLPFNSNPEDSCVAGGLYFSDAENIIEHLNYDYYYIREVEVPEGELIIKTHTGKCRAHSLFLHKRRSLYEAETWKWLKEQGVNIDKALYWTAYCGHTEIAKTLIDLKVDLNIPDIVNGRTPLMWTIYKGCTEIAQMLIYAGANFDIQDKGNATALLYATGGNHKEIAKMLIKVSANLDIQDEDGNTALINAAFRGSTEILQMLIDAKANLDIQNNFGWTALRAARKTKIVQMLIDAGANTEIKNNVGETYKDYITEE